MPSIARLSSVLIAALVFSLFSAAAAQAQNERPAPAEVRRCTKAVNVMTRDTVTDNRRIANRTARRVTALLEAGEQDQAIEAARKSVKRINTNSTAGVGDVTERCARCIRRLEAAEAPAELLEKVESFCERKVGQIGKSQENAKQKIRDAFGDTDPGELE